MNRVKKRVIICSILIVVIVANSYLLAKYRSSFSGSDSSSIAKWNVSYDDTDNATKEVNLVFGNQSIEQYTLKVTSISEVSSKYSIILSNVPSELEVSLDGGTYATPTNNRIVFSNVGSFSVSDINMTHTHTLRFNAPLNANIGSTNYVDIDIKFEQTD